MSPVDPEVVVIGGGATGCGVAWDLSLRGIRTVLVERADTAGGTSGRYHGLLHSGARYAVADPAAAGECASENRILRRIASPFIVDTGGLFILLQGDNEDYVPRWLSACTEMRVPAGEISAGEAARREERLSRKIARVFEVRDAVCLSMPLCGALRAAAAARGAVFHTFHRLDGFIQSGGAVSGVHVTDLRSGEKRAISCACVVNAAGPWAGEVAGMAGARIVMSLLRGAMLAFEGVLTRAVVNRLAPPDDGDIVLPRGRVTIAGTTTVPTDDPSDGRVEEWERALLRERAAALIPALATAGARHAWSAVRPLYKPGTQPVAQPVATGMQHGTQPGAPGAQPGEPGAGPAEDPRLLSRDFTVINHARVGGPAGLVSIVGGKLTTFRLMAEKTADEVCRILGVRAACRTAETEIRA